MVASTISKYIELKEQEANKLISDLKEDIRLTARPKQMDEYTKCISLMQQRLKDVEAAKFSYDMADVKKSISAAFDELAVQQDEEIVAVSEKYEAMIANTKEDIESEAKMHNALLQTKLDMDNRVYLELEDKRKQLEGYADEIIERCSVYGVTTSDITISNSTFSVEELGKIYDQYIEFMKKPSSVRKNFITSLRKKVPDVKAQGVLLLVAFILAVVPYLVSVVSIVGFIGLFRKQQKVVEHMETYALLLGLVYNVHPLDMGFKGEVDASELHNEVVNEEDSKEIDAIAEEMSQALEEVIAKYDLEVKEEAANIELVNQTPEAQKKLDALVLKFAEDKKNLAAEVEAEIKKMQEEFEDAKSKVQKLGSTATKSVVMNTNFMLGLKDGIIPEYVDIGTNNVVIRPNADKIASRKFLQALLVNALCNVKVGNMTVYVYDPNNSGQDVIGFYDKEIEDMFIIKHEGLESVISELREFAMQNSKEMQGLTIREFNKRAEELNQVEKDYKLLMVLSQPKSIEEDEALSSFMGYSANMGVLVWVVSTKDVPNTYVFDKPFAGVSTPYPIDLSTFSHDVTKMLVKERKANSRPAPLFWEDYIANAVPDSKRWTYSCDEFIDIDPGYENGDREKFIGYTVGNTGDIHALAAGMTGAGKSVFLNALLATMCQKHSPRDLELWLIDYKAVEFGFFIPKPGQEYTLPHIKTCLCTTDGDFAESVYAALDKECQRRFRLFEENGVKNLKAFNKKMRGAGTPEKCLPRILFVNDEFQVIFETAKDKVLDSISKSLTSVAKLGRAAGAHLMFTSQSMNKTVSADVLNQFTLRFALKCDETVSLELLGNKKSALMKEGVGFCYAASKNDKSQDAQKKWKVPYFAEDKDGAPIKLRELMKTLWDEAEKQGIPRKRMITYNEKDQHDIHELESLWDDLNKAGTAPETGLIILGSKMVYDVEAPGPLNIIMEPENGAHVFSVFKNSEDVVDFYKQIMCNFKHYRQQPQVFVNAQDNNMYYLCSVDKQMVGAQESLGTPKTNIVNIVAMMSAVYEARKASNKKDEPVYFILLGWDKATGFGVEKDYDTVSAFTLLVKQCGEYNMHIIMICNDIESIPSSFVSSFKYKICGVCSENASYAVLDSKQGSQPSSLSSGFLYLNTGQGFPKRAKLYISEKDREIKKTSLNL